MRMITIFLLLISMQGVCISAELVERVAAVVGDEVVLLSEFEEAMESAAESRNAYTKEDVINRMINRIILLREAKRFGFERSIEGPVDAESVIKQYIERRIKAFIHIPYDQIEKYYADNRDKFGDSEFYDVKNEIEEYLVSRELVKRLREYIEGQRKKLYIRVQLEEHPPEAMD